jgi:hypothetical protein
VIRLIKNMITINCCNKFKLYNVWPHVFNGLSKSVALIILIWRSLYMVGRSIDRTYSCFEI